MITSPHILVVDDDPEIRDLLRAFLQRELFRVSTARDADDARRALLDERYELVVLDLMLPGESGLDFARWLQANGSLPVIMLTAMSEEADRIAGLDLGADDYVTKPFNPRELLARIRAVLRRAGAQRAGVRLPAVKHYRFSGWNLEIARRRLTDPQGAYVALTGREYALLLTFLQYPSRVLTREALLELLSGHQSGILDRSIDVVISRLRHKLEDDGHNGRIIKTVRGDGYVLAAPVEPR